MEVFLWVIYINIRYILVNVLGCSLFIYFGGLILSYYQVSNQFQELLQLLCVCSKLPASKHNLFAKSRGSRGQGCKMTGSCFKVSKGGKCQFFPRWIPPSSCGVDVMSTDFCGRPAVHGDCWRCWYRFLGVFLQQPFAKSSSEIR